MGRRLARQSIFKGEPGGGDLESPEGKRFLQLKLSHVMDEVSRDLKLRDDSVEIEVQNKIAEAENLFTAFDIGKLVTKKTVMEEDFFDILRTELDNKDTEDLLDQSFKIPEPEINLRFNDPFTDHNRFTLAKVVSVCQVILSD